MIQGGRRIYTDEQKAAMFALYEQGCQPAEISRRCREGLASVARFDPPRKSVEYVVKTMARERGFDPPRKVEQIAGWADASRYGERVIELLSEDLERLEARDKTAKPLSIAEYERLAKGMKIVAEIRRQTVARPEQTRSGPGPGEEDALDRIARDLATRERDTAPEAGEQLTDVEPVSEAEPAPDPETDPLLSILNSDDSTEEKQRRMLEHFESNLEANGDDG